MNNTPIHNMDYIDSHFIKISIDEESLVLQDEKIEYFDISKDTKFGNYFFSEPAICDQSGRELKPQRINGFVGGNVFYLFNCPQHLMLENEYNIIKSQEYMQELKYSRLLGQIDYVLTFSIMDCSLKERLDFAIQEIFQTKTYINQIDFYIEAIENELQFLKRFTFEKRENGLNKTEIENIFNSILRLHDLLTIKSR